MKLSSRFVALVLSIGLAVAPAARAVGTRTFELNSIDELSGGDLKGTTVDSLGRVRAGFDLGSLPVGEATSIWSALPQADGSVLLGTGNSGRIFRVAGGQVTPYGETGQLAVTALVVGFNKAVFAATIPNGRVLRLDGNKAAKFVDLEGADHVWALAFDAKQNALFAATGPQGKLFRIDGSGNAQVYFDSDEPHLVSLALADGTLYAGSSGKALLYKITGPGRATVLYDFPGEDVKGVAVGPKGVVYAISNEYSDLPDIPKRGSSGQTPAAPVTAARPKPGKGTLTRVDDGGRPERLLRREDTHFASVAVGDDGRPYVGTGVEGRVYSVDDAHTSTLVADTDERQIAVLILAGGKRFIAGSDPAVLHEVRGMAGPNAVWTSKVLDAGLRAHFGRLVWRATGTVEMSTRSGNTQVPDKAWSDWSAPLPSPGKVASPAARFAQVRPRFSRDPNAVVSQVVLPFVTDNLRAVVTSVDAQPKNTPPAVKEKENVFPSSGGEPERHATVIKLTWKVDNPDSDALRYRLSYRLDGQNVYREITRPDESLTKTEYEWETASLPEGPYRVRVEATDETVNPPDRSFKHALESPVIIVDNTPPVFRTLAAQGRRIRGDAVDGVGPIARFDFDDEARTEWRPFLPADGVFDETVEAFDFDVSTFVGAGNHLVAVRVFDQAGNFVVRNV